MFFLAWVFMFIGKAGVAAVAPDFQNMEMLELKEFLKARGEPCPACVEKSDFVQRAIAVQDQPPTAKTQEAKKQEIMDEINGIRTSMGLDPMSAGDVDDQIDEARLKATTTPKAKTTAKTKTTTEPPKKPKPTNDKTTKSSEKSSSTRKTEEEKSNKRAQTTKPEKKEEKKKTETKKEDKKKDSSEEKNKKSSTPASKSKRPEEDKKAATDEKAAKPKKVDDKKSKEADKTKKPETKPDRTKDAKADKTKEAKADKTKEAKADKTKADKTKDTKSDKTKDAKKPASKDKEKAKEKSKDSGTIGMVWRTRGVKACEGVLKEDANAALALPDVCGMYGSAIFEVFEEFDKNMAGLSFLNMGGTATKSSLKTTSLTQPFLASGLKVVKTAASLVIIEASKPPATTPKICPEVMCSMFCEHGFKKDQDGCDTCVCNEEAELPPATLPKTCPEVMCSLYCEHGFKKGQDGCETCVCNEVGEAGAVGGHKDEHGCATGGGYTWCEAKGKCLRTWEEPCEEVPASGEKPQETAAPIEEKSLLDRIKDITRKETMSWLFEVAMKNPEKLRKQKEFDDLLKKGKFGDGWDSSSPPSASRKPPPRQGKPSEAEAYFDSFFEDKEVEKEPAPKARGQVPPTLLRKGSNQRDARTHALEPEELDGVLDLDGPLHDEI